MSNFTNTVIIMNVHCKLPSLVCCFLVKINLNTMAEVSDKDWVDITDFQEFDITWVNRKYTCEKYLFAEEYSRDEIKKRILDSHRMRDTIEKVYIYNISLL